MLLFYVIMYLMRWCALFMTGGQIALWLAGISPISESLMIFGMALFMWLIGKGLDFVLGHPNPPKFLNTRKKRITAAVISFLMGFILFTGV